MFVPITNGIGGEIKITIKIESKNGKELNPPLPH